jgi:hypothetical protein
VVLLYRQPLCPVAGAGQRPVTPPFPGLWAGGLAHCCDARRGLVGFRAFAVDAPVGLLVVRAHLIVDGAVRVQWWNGQGPSFGFVLSRRELEDGPRAPAVRHCSRAGPSESGA